MSIKALWVAIAAGTVLTASGITGAVLVVDRLSHAPMPAMVCSPPMPGGDGTADCVRIHATPSEPAKTAAPGPTNVIGLKCPDGQHWVDLDNRSYCAPNS